MAEQVDDFLTHVGIKGMKWGKRKRKDEKSDSKPNSASDENRDARRKAKSDKILSKADGVQKQIDDLKKNGTNSEFMRKKYGDAMGIDSRSADMSVQFQHKHTKKELLDAELKGLEASKAHLKADANLAAQGKLTQKEKMLIGAGIATVVLASAVTVAVINDKNKTNQRRAQLIADSKARRIKDEEKLQDASYLKSVATRDAENKARRQKYLADQKAETDRFNGIQPGKKITYDDYWKKIENTEMSRISGISKDAFDKMDDTPISVPAGHIFKRVSTDKEEVLRKQMYAAFKDEDVDRYQAILPQFWSRWGIGSEAKGGYVVSIKAKEAIVSPSQKQRVQAFIELMDENVKDQSDSRREGRTKTGREWLDMTPAARLSDRFDLSGKSMNPKTNEEQALSQYRNFALGLVNKTPLSDAYFDKLKSKGFNAIIDDNDAGKLSDSPMLIFDTSKSMERLGATPLNQETIDAARNRIVEVLQRA